MGRWRRSTSGGPGAVLGLSCSQKGGMRRVGRSGLRPGSMKERLSRRPVRGTPPLAVWSKHACPLDATSASVSSDGTTRHGIRTPTAHHSRFSRPLAREIPATRGVPLARWTSADCSPVATATSTRVAGPGWRGSVSTRCSRMSTPSAVLTACASGSSGVGATCSHAGCRSPRS